MSSNEKTFRKRRILSLIIIAFLSTIAIFSNPDFWGKKSPNQQTSQISQDLNSLQVKGRAPKTGYSREQFGKGWAKDSNGCDTRNRILKRDLKEAQENSKCQIINGTLDDPYTGKQIIFSREKASAVQIDHVVALSDAWQKGAQQISKEDRKELANDPLNLLASDGPANQQKGDSDAATWLPPNKSFRCEYVSRQIAVKKKYKLWVTEAEKSAMQTVLTNC